jgi:peptidoglycan/xylan/chitin deacetylase (PgdA/CDA1 family)
MIHYKKFLISILFLVCYFVSIHSSISETIKDYGASVFMYHRIGESEYPSTNVTIEQFDQHIDYISTNNFNIVPLSDIVAIIQDKQEFIKSTISFSIDDAYESFYLNAWPKFRENNIPVTLFISTEIIDNKTNGYMTWDQIRNFIVEGGNVGQHTSSHIHMPLNTKESVKEDILNSHKSFMKELGFIPELFAYPYGETSKEVINILKEFNITHAFGQHSGVISIYDNEHYLPRFSLNEQFGDLDRFIFAAKSSPLIIKDFIPSEMYLTENLQPRIEFTIKSNIDINQLNCFANTGGNWSNQKITNITEKRVQIILDDSFNSGRGRINCTVQKDKNWHWFGYQFLIK